jgi:formate hydrogenlyase subunit 6/NADH:ubiquinone oxidoreductase subunit I
MGYFNDIREGIKTTLTGLSLTGRHLREAVRRREVIGVETDTYFEQADGLVTVQYPHETLPIPDNGRYRLHNEIDDCIVCDKCAKICPVDCITIDPIKATEEVGRASDGSPIRLYAATFDIDMAKCCYCGLCTVVCPTECLTMEKTFDYSTYDLGNLTYAFANLTPEQADEKRALYEQYVREKEAAKVAAKPATPPTADVPTPAPTAKPKPVFRPGMKPASAPPPELMERAANVPEPAPKPKPVFRPGMKPKPTTEPAANVPEPTIENVPEPVANVPTKPKPAFRPSMKPKPTPQPDATPTEAEAIAMQDVPEQPGVTEPIEAPAPKPKPTFKPTMKPK